MNELMQHVERIVRPILATQSRKLRMRQELLSHLTIAVDQERKAGAGDQIAIERAVARLGDAESLTQQLQRTVPWVQRILLARMPISPKVDLIGAKFAERVYGLKAMSLGHIAILSAAAGLLAGVPVLPVRAALTQSGSPPHSPGLFFVSLLLGLQLMLVLSLRFAVGAADVSRPTLGRTTVLRGGGIVGLHLAIAFAAFEFGLGRLPSILEIAGVMFVSAGLLIFTLLVARAVGRLRRAYDPWMSLDVAA